VDPARHDDDRPQVIALLEEIMTSATRDSWENTFRIVRPDGNRGLDPEAGDAPTATPTARSRGSPARSRLQPAPADEQARQTRRDEEHDRALRTLLETATQGIVSVDARGLIATANQAFEAMFGWATGDLIGRPIERLMPSAFATGMSATASCTWAASAGTAPRFPSKSA